MSKLLPAVIVVAACSSRTEAPVERIDLAAPAKPQITAEGAWAGSASVHDVLGRDPSVIRRIQVPRRNLPRGITVAGPVSGHWIVTHCDDGSCIDGLATNAAINDGRLEPCAVWSETGVARVTHPGGVCEFVKRPALGDEEAFPHEPGSWFERGVKVAQVSGAWVSFYQADAWFSQGAAHSNASLECRTHGALGTQSLVGYFPADEAAAIIDAADRFVAQEREVGDDRAREIELDRSVLTTSFLIDGPSSVILCAPTTTGDGVVHQIRVSLQRSI